MPQSHRCARDFLHLGIDTILPPLRIHVGILLFMACVCDREMRERLDIRGGDTCFRIFRKQEAGIRLYNARRSNSFTAHAVDIYTVALS